MVSAEKSNVFPVTISFELLQLRSSEYFINLKMNTEIFNKQ